MEKDFSLQGKILMATPALEDPNFARAVVYMCAHSAEGAVGLIVNRPLGNLRLEDIFERFSIEGKEKEGLGKMAVHLGGPVEMNRGFVLHRERQHGEEALHVDEDIVMTGSMEILREMAEGKISDECFLALGYAGWSGGQLEKEIQANGWLHCESDPFLIFGGEDAKKYSRALEKIGVSEESFSEEAGHS